MIAPEMATNDPLAPFLPARTGPALTHAFARRSAMMPWRGLRAVADADLGARVAWLEATPRPKTAAVAYVHVPFCVSRCLFCGFYRNSDDRARTRRYADLMVVDLDRAAALPMVAEGPPLSAVYIGGGTPTALSASEIAVLVGALKTRLPLAADCEITLEGRMFGFDDAKIDAALDAGVNRISLGVQSFDTRVRRRLGRKLDRAQLVEAISGLVARGRAVVVIDLIYGLPGQTAEVWRSDIETAAALGLDGLDYYALGVHPNGPLAQAIAAGKTLPVPTLADQAHAYAAARAFFAEQGWTRLSQAHVARTPRERSLYNRLVKTDAGCLAFGPGAGGGGFGSSWSMETDLDAWARAVETGRSAIGRMGDLPPVHEADALIAASLESGQLDLVAVERRRPGFVDAAAPLLGAWREVGLIALDGGLLRTTIAGDFWMTTLAQGLATACEHARGRRAA
ncbi:oxygen-independent coproporphyrinogen-3 oxidase [Rhodoblastus acidophilus]|uniref:heme anaerobic degradation radical SAM methyltransferase ChuW/HutW n=1 Tax=Rhodoblastus acidophilus TaxID=1074 RepID=UPI0022251AE2|nr:heme anaerobic degradation radical SAM methyltransferase ChuW/HutW [Rhodoblastus acidophilus]MCW2318359.1 oxygen-independent coproporphyrinogen-3 oxidase [Rhodoblastus acidophilus]